MNAPTDQFNNLSEEQRSSHIRQVVMDYGIELRQRYPILLYQNTIGAGVLVFSLLAMMTCALLFIQGHMAWWVCLLLNAFFASLTHEIEHDLLHTMYFRKQPFLQNSMLTLAWLARPSTINPWVRRNLHLYHHKNSGTEADLEERAISNGTPWGILRLLMVADLMIASTVNILTAKKWSEKWKIIRVGSKGFTPLALLNWGTWYVFLGFHAGSIVANLLGTPIIWSTNTLAMMNIVNVAVVVLVGPNILRTFCLHFVSSNLHYYGDLESNNVIQTTQVLNPWWLYPMQLFCCNFGSTHSIHHFVVKEPFYIRQLSAPVAHKVMREMGVRFNDYGTFTRANRWTRFDDFILPKAFL